MSVAVIAYHPAMSRWQPDSRGRLAKAALVLYDDQGFDKTTVAEIAEQAGVTERTFFRHFPDKREALFGGNQSLEATLAAGIAAAPPGLAPIDAVAAGLEAVAEMLGERRDFARRRRRVIAANPELRERDLVKNAELATALAAALRDYGVDEATAPLAAEAGISVFKVAMARWTEGDEKQPLADLLDESLAQLKAVTAAA
jgi:AcrR family transcriptional regulator